MGISLTDKYPCRFFVPLDGIGTQNDRWMSQVSHSPNLGMNIPREAKVRSLEDLFLPPA
jgi:hypothetical protein